MLDNVGQLSLAMLKIKRIKLEELRIVLRSIDYATYENLKVKEKKLEVFQKAGQSRCVKCGAYRFDYDYEENYDKNVTIYVPENKITGCSEHLKSRCHRCGYVFKEHCGHQ